MAQGPLDPGPSSAEAHSVGANAEATGKAQARARVSGPVEPADGGARGGASEESRDSADSESEGSEAEPRCRAARRRKKGSARRRKVRVMKLPRVGSLQLRRKVKLLTYTSAALIALHLLVVSWNRSRAPGPGTPAQELRKSTHATWQEQLTQVVPLRTRSLSSVDLALSSLGGRLPNEKGNGVAGSLIPRNQGLEAGDSADLGGRDALVEGPEVGSPGSQDLLQEPSSSSHAEGAGEVLASRGGVEGASSRGPTRRAVPSPLLLPRLNPARGDACPDRIAFSARIAGAKSKGVLRWEPRPGKYLVMHCARGQVSNLVACISNHILVAGLLNRTLVVPLTLHRSKALYGRVFHKRRAHWVKHYERKLFWDLAHTQQCYGRSTVISAGDLGAESRSPVSPEKVLCWRGPKDACHPSGGDVVGDYVSEGNCPGTAQQSRDGLAKSRSHAPRVEMGPTQVLPVQATSAQMGKGMLFPPHTPVMAACLPRVATLDDFIRLYSSLTDDVSMLSVGDLVNHEFESGSWVYEWGEHPFLRSEECRGSLSVVPPTLYLDTTKQIIQKAVEGRPFLSVHWRQGDFKQYCIDQGPKGACWFKSAQAASCAVEAARQHNLTNIFLASNAKESEVSAFVKKVAEESGGSISVFRVPKETLLSPVWAKEFGGGTAVRHKDTIALTLDKVICAQAKVFLGSVMSTFSTDIQRMRFGFGTASCADSTLCHGEKEWKKPRKQPRQWR